MSVTMGLPVVHVVLAITSHQEPRTANVSNIFIH